MLQSYLHAVGCRQQRGVWLWEYSLAGSGCDAAGWSLPKSALVLLTTADSAPLPAPQPFCKISLLHLAAGCAGSAWLPAKSECNGLLSLQPECSGVLYEVSGHATLLKSTLRREEKMR